jgi:gamma-glutamylcysteine synthetase
MEEAALKGLAGELAGEPLLRIASDVVSIASLGLSRIDRVEGTSDRNLLDPLREILEAGKSPGERTREGWNGDLRRFLEREKL